MRRLSLAIAAALTFWGVANAQTLPVRATPVSASSAAVDLPVAAGQASYVNLGGALRFPISDPNVRQHHFVWSTKD